MLLQNYLDVDELYRNLHSGYIMQKSHPVYPLKLLCYTRAAQYDSAWSDAVSKCRGLIAEEETGRIVGFCMPKFHNKTEHDNGKPYAKPLPKYEDFQIFDKMDGSMGTVYYYNGFWHVATKGSFGSEQAEKATHMLRDINTDLLIPDTTYVVEIIYPSNRIVVDYGDRKDLVLLTSYSANGTEILNPPEWESTGFSYIKSYGRAAGLTHNDSDGLDKLVEHSPSGTEAEGFVVRFESGTRVKLKYAEYLALHKILTNCTERTIWEAMSTGTGLDQFFDNVPDEFDSWATSVINRLEDSFTEYQVIVAGLFNKVLKDLNNPTRKEFASAVANCEYKGALFRILDGKSIDDMAWKSCYPKNEKPFK